MFARRFVPPHLVDDVEDVEAYRPGGFHPISIGDCFAQGRYRVLHKLGHGGSSTVWLARDQGGAEPGRLVALKVVRADASNIHNPALIIPEILRAASPSCSNIHTVNHHFFEQGPNGSHLFLVSPFAGPSILAMSDCPGRVAGSRRLRADLARKVVIQIATTVHRMHRAGIVHGDITTSNILFCLSSHVLKWTDTEVYVELGDPMTEKVRTLDGQPSPPCAPAELIAPIDNARLTDPSFLQESVILADFGQSFVAASRPPNYEPATLPHYYPPEARFEGRASFEADVWGLGCAIFEIRSGFPLFSSFLGGEADILRQTVEILGRLPDPWWGRFKQRALWFEDNGEPKSIQDQESAGVLLHASQSSLREHLRSIGTQDGAPPYDEGAMIEQPGVRLCEKEVALLGDLLEKMLQYRPEDRIGMQEVIMHPWLEMSGGCSQC